jgi:hypothetical protein
MTFSLGYTILEYKAIENLLCGYAALKYIKSWYTRPANPNGVSSGYTQRFTKRTQENMGQIND